MVDTLYFRGTSIVHITKTGIDSIHENEAWYSSGSS